MNDPSTVATAAAPGYQAIVLPLFHRVPDVVWAALIAAGIAFLTTVLSNRNSRRQLQMQLDHTAAQQDRDRAMSLRREVYLPAVEAVTRAQGLLGQVADLDTNLNDVTKQIADAFATMAKVHLIASESTVEALLTFQQKLSLAYIDLISLRLPLTYRRQAIGAEQRILDKTLAEKESLIQQMKHLNIAGSQDAGAMYRLKLQFDNEESMFQMHLAAKTKLEQEQLGEHLALSARHVALNLELVQCMPDALISARQELDLQIDPTKYRYLFGKQQQAMHDAMSAFIDRVKALATRAQQPPVDATPGPPERGQ